MSVVRRVLDRDFADVVLGSAIPVVVGFSASWSAACAPLIAVLDELAVDATSPSVVRVDIDAAPRTAAAYGISSVPSVLVFNAGALVLALPGAPTSAAIKSMVHVAVPASAPSSGPL